VLSVGLAAHAVELGLATVSHAITLPLDQPFLDATISGGAELKRTVHPSGLRILTEKVPGAASTSVGFWVGVGSRDEDEIAFGSTHFLEHLLFKGTPTRSALDIAVAFDRVGGEHNALTAKEHTCYYAKVQDRDVPMAIDVLADMVAASVIDADEFDVERRVILEELAMADDDPSDVAHERVTEAVMGDHPLGRPIGGSPETIKAASREQVVAHYERYYHPGELVVTVAGALDHDDVVEQVLSALTRYGWDLDATGSPTPRRNTARARLHGGASRQVIHRPLEQATVMLSMPGFTQTDPRRPAQAVLTTVLGGGMSSRLFQEVREKRGLAYSVYAYGGNYSDAGLFGMGAGTAPEHVSTVTAVMRGIFGDIVDEGITAEEFERTRGNLQGSSSLALESTEARMVRLGRSELHLGEFVDRDEALRRLDLVTLEDVKELAVELAGKPLSAVAVGAVHDSVFDVLDD
jgi:predicted Zn-dependent peptidase